MQVYLIRHAQSEINVQLDDQPLNMRLSRNAFNALLGHDRESPLTPAGIVQARHLAQRFTDKSFSRLYTSPLPRAVDTAAALSETTGLTPQIITELQELRADPLRAGDHEITLRHLFFDAYAHMLFSPTSSDAFFTVIKRARAVWSQITCEPAEAIVVVSHGWFLRFLLLSLWPDRRWRIVSRDFTNCGISLVISREQAR